MISTILVYLFVLLLLSLHVKKQYRLFSQGVKPKQAKYVIKTSSGLYNDTLAYVTRIITHIKLFTPSFYRVFHSARKKLCFNMANFKSLFLLLTKQKYNVWKVFVITTLKFLGY